MEDYVSNSTIKHIINTKFRQIQLALNNHYVYSTSDPFHETRIITKMGPLNVLQLPSKSGHRIHLYSFEVEHVLKYTLT